MIGRMVDCLVYSIASTIGYERILLFFYDLIDALILFLASVTVLRIFILGASILTSTNVVLVDIFIFFIDTKERAHNSG